MKNYSNRFNSISNPKRMMGAAIAEYLPIISLIAVISLGGVMEYAKKIRTQGGIISEELAGFGDPAVVAPSTGSGGGSGSGSVGSGGGASEGGGSGSTTTPPKPDPSDGGPSTGAPGPTIPDPTIPDAGDPVGGGDSLVDEDTSGSSTETPGPVAIEDDSSVFESAAAFFDGLWTGLKSQFTGLLEMILHPIDTFNGFKELAIAFATDPEGTTKVLIEEFAKDVEKIKSGDPRLIGEVIGENISPAALARVVGKLSAVSKSPAIVAQRERAAARLDRECSGSSFLAGTLVWSEKGMLPVESLKVGDSVYGRNDATFTDGLQRISALHGRDVNRYYELDTGYEKILVTEEHPFWLQGKGWVAVSTLNEGDVVARAEGDIQVHKINLINGPARVYNFTVVETHSYFVGPNKLWVHNTSGPCPIDFESSKPTLEDIAKGVPESLRKDFEADFKDEDFAAAMMADPDLAKAWTVAHGNPVLRKNTQLLKKVDGLLKNKNVTDVIDEEALARVISTKFHPEKTSPGYGFVNLERHLDNIENFVTNYKDVPGFGKMVNDIKNPYWAMQKGVTHALENIRAYPPASVRKIDMTIDEDGIICDTCRFDLELDKDISEGGVRFVEFKSYKLTSIEKYLSVKQLKAYFESSSSMGEMKYVFNKLETPDLPAVKAEFQKVFQKDSKSFFDAMSDDMKDSLGATTLAEFNKLVGDPTSKLYTFIEVK